MANRLTLNPIPLQTLSNKDGLKEGSSVLTVLEFPTTARSDIEAVLPHHTADVGIAINNETELVLKTIKLSVLIDIYGTRARQG